MTAYLLPGMAGLLLGLLLHWAGFSKAGGVRAAISFRRSYPLRSALSAVGLSLAATALLMWLAVLDVDGVEILPLSLGTLIGGAVMGIAIALCGCTPTTAFAMLGGGNALEALSALVGCAGAALLLPSLEQFFTPLRTAQPYVPATLFEVTLDEPWLLGGGFAGLGALGLLIWVIGVCIPSPRPILLMEEEAARRAEALSAEEAAQNGEAPAQDAPEEADSGEAGQEEDSPAEEASEDAQEPPQDDPAAETFVAILEGEEPLIVDTDADSHGENPQDAPEKSAKE